MVNFELFRVLFFCVRLGVDSAKWNRARRKPEATAAISAANAESEFDQREATYEKYRDELTAELK